MVTLTPILTGTPGQPPSYNVGIAETFSWVPVENDANRPLFARATYLTNAEDIKVSLSAGNINVSLDDLELNTDNVEELIEATNATLTAFRAETKSEIDQTNTLLSVLTGTQNNSVSLLEALTANTDGLEVLVQENNTLLSSLTSIQVDKQDQVITLLHQLTANTDALEVNTDNVESLLEVLTAVDFATSFNQQETNTLLNVLTSSNEQIQLNSSSAVTLLNELTSSNVHVAGFNIPPYDEINLEYVGSTEYINKVSYLNNTTQVLALSFVYVTEPPTTSDNRILKVKKL